MPTRTIPTSAQQDRAAELVQLARSTDDAEQVIAQELADAAAASPTAVDAEQQLLREIVPLLNALPYSAAPTRRIDSDSIPSYVLVWLREYRTHVAMRAELADAQGRDLSALKSDIAGMRRILGGAYTG